MIITVAGQDRTHELRACLNAAMAPRNPKRFPRFLPKTISAITLLDSASNADYLARLLKLVRRRDTVNALPFEIPRKPGLFSGMATIARSFLWRLLRYQHDRIIFQQNLINMLFTSALENELLQRESEIRLLCARIDSLERQLNPNCVLEKSAFQR